MSKRYSLEYCGTKYLIVERNENKILHEGSYESCKRFKAENKIKYFDE